MSSQATATAGSYEFKAETRQLLDIVINSLYSSKEIFLRELISNSSDALDRLRFEALTSPELMEKGEILEIRIEADTDARTLSIIDNGIGMSRQEVIDNLGTIAKSGTREVLEQLEKGDKGRDSIAQLIGQFGVGFYSSFIVADKVTVVARRAGEETATRWESDGGGSFEIGDDSRFLRGTTVTLHLKPADPDNGLDDFADHYVFQNVVKRYSDFIPYPIRTKIPLQEPELDSEGKPIPGKTTSKIEEVTLNSMKPIWTRPADEVKDEEYTEFYRHISHDWSEPLDRLSARAEGRIEYQALLFLPGKAPFDLYYRDQNIGLQLYVKRVMIMDRCEALLPTWLRFVKGVVDSADLQLNLSREMLQQDRHINQMRKWITRKVLDHLKEMRTTDEEKYLKFWNEFGSVIKEGVSGDPDNQKRIVPLLLFNSSADSTKLTDLAGYLERMKEDQEEIFYLSGENRTAVESSPHLEAFAARGVEVLYLVDAIDEILVQALAEWEGKKLRSAASGEVDLGAKEDNDEADKELEEKKEEYKSLLEALQGKLGDQVKEVRLSSRLTTSPSCLVGEEGDISPQLERLLRQTEGAMEVPSQKRVLELNAKHEVMTKLQQRFAEDGEDPALDDYAELLLGYALLAEGSDLPDPSKFNRLLAELMGRGL